MFRPPPGDALPTFLMLIHLPVGLNNAHYRQAVFRVILNTLAIFYANYVCMSLAEFGAFINCNFIFLKQNYFSIFYYKMDNYVTLLHAKN